MSLTISLISQVCFGVGTNSRRNGSVSQRGWPGRRTGRNGIPLDAALDVGDALLELAWYSGVSFAVVRTPAGRSGRR
jgi:hypothetical protein